MRLVGRIPTDNKSKIYDHVDTLAEKYPNVFIECLIVLDIDPRKLSIKQAKAIKNYFLKNYPASWRRRRPVEMWRTVNEDEFVTQYQCLNCKGHWWCDEPPSSWKCCPKCLVIWKREWVKKNPRFVYDEYDWPRNRKFRPKLHPLWEIEVLVPERFSFEKPRKLVWEKYGTVENSQTNREMTFDLGDGKVMRGVSGLLKLQLHCCKKEHPESSIRIKYYDRVNPGRVVKEYGK